MNNIHKTVSFITDFPDFSAPGFDMDAYNNFFRTTNSIINASASDIAYKEHWGCLSVKCAFGGNEFYKSQRRVYSVNDQNFLILNEGQYYSSYIFSKKPVESFTLNFTQAFAKEIIQSITSSDEKILDNPFSENKSIPEFVEKLYQHNYTLSPLIFTIRKLSKNFNANRHLVTELYYPLVEQLFFLHKEIKTEINNISALRLSTRKELYKRLHYAKDYIDSCYASQITLEELSLISLMNTAHFLRQFKKHFHITPYQYLIHKRIDAAAALLKNSNLSVTEICTAVGYEDHSSFTKLFKKNFGSSPEVYRNHIL
jgi:AraC family transcriptional regulator